MFGGFGGFGGSPAPSSGAAPSSSFDGFGGASPAPPTTAATPPTSFLGGFGGFGAANPAPTPATGAGDLGGFGATGGMGGAMGNMGGMMGAAAMGGMMGGAAMGGMGGMMGSGATPDLMTCSGCGQLIADNNFLTAFRMYWHPQHLMCAVCKKDFSDRRKIEEGPDGFAYCSPCLVQKFAPRCGKCGEAIVGPFINAVGKAFHQQCFVCSKCEKPFTGNFYPTDKGEVLCEQDFYKSQGLWCAGCDAPIITGRLVSMGEKKFHPDHFLCGQCRTKLTGKKYVERSGKPYCEACNLALFE